MKQRRGNIRVPYGSLLSDELGYLWGTTQGGGSGGSGTVYKIEASTGLLTTVVSFTQTDKSQSPHAGLVSDGLGSYWGTTEYGKGNQGSIFKVNASTGVFTTVIEFTGNGATNKGAAPLATLVSDGTGNLWSTTAFGGANGFGTLFKVNAGTGVLTTVSEFANAAPVHNAAFVNDGAGSFLSTTRNSYHTYFTEEVYQVNSKSGAIKTLAAFTDGGPRFRGLYPTATLASDEMGFLWGTTEAGGANGFGTIFRVNPESNVVSTIVELTGTTGPFKGAVPAGNLVSDGAGYMWGSTSAGGDGNFGTLFKVNQSTGAMITVLSFTKDGVQNRGSGPRADLLNDDAGFLWGTTTKGGVADAGTLFKVDLKTGVLTTLREFTFGGSDKTGYYPSSGLTGDSAGFLWGTLGGGGANNFGTVYKVNPNTGEVTSVVSLTGQNGPNRGDAPEGTLMADGLGWLWGTTSSGVSGIRTVFKVFAATGDFISFQDLYSVAPTYEGGLTVGLAYQRGAMWGAGRYGDVFSYETLFKIDVRTRALTLVSQFDALPRPAFNPFPGNSAIHRHSDGNLYGIARVGGPDGGGSVYRIRFGPTPLTQGATALMTSATVHGTINPQSDGDTDWSFQYSLDSTFAAATSVSGGTLANDTASSPVALTLSGLQPGRIYFYRIIASNAGNAVPQKGATASFQTLPDTMAPQLANTPADVTVEATGPDGAMVSYAMPTASDDVAVASFVTSKESGATFPIGKTTVTFTAADTSGNTSSTSFDVTVVDRIAPVVLGNFAPVIVSEGVLPNYDSQVIATDAVGVTSIFQEPPAGSATVASSVTVTMNATDAAGNVGSTSFIVDVRPSNTVNQTSVKTGDYAPGSGLPGGPPAGAKFTAFGPPTIDDGGQIAYRAMWSGAGGSGLGLFTRTGCLAAVGRDVPGVSGSHFSALYDPVLDAGHAAFPAVMSRAGQAATVGVFSDTPGSIALVAETGAAAPGTGSAPGVGEGLFKSFTSIALSADTVAFSGELQPGTGHPAVTAENNSGLWLKKSFGPLVLIARTGPQPHGPPIRALVSLRGGTGSPGQGRGWLSTSATGEPHVLALAFFATQPPTQAILSYSLQGEPAVLSQTGPGGMGGLTYPGARFVSYGLPATNATGDSAFLGSVAIVPGGSSAPTSFANGVFTRQGGQPMASPYEVLAYVGQKAGATGGYFERFYDPVLASDGQLAFPAVLRAGNVTATSIWHRPPGGSLTMLARTGQNPGPEVPAAARWEAFTSLAIAANRGPIFTGAMTAGLGGVTAPTAYGLWAMDFTGVLRLLVRSGVTQIDGKIVQNGVVFSPMAGSLGVSHSFNDRGQVAWIANFADKSQGIIVTEVP